MVRSDGTSTPIYGEEQPLPFCFHQTTQLDRSGPAPPTITV